MEYNGLNELYNGIKLIANYGARFLALAAVCLFILFFYFPIFKFLLYVFNFPPFESDFENYEFANNLRKISYFLSLLVVMAVIFLLEKIFP